MGEKSRMLTKVLKSNRLHRWWERECERWKRKEERVEWKCGLWRSQRIKRGGERRVWNRKRKPAVDRGAIPRGCENADRTEDGGGRKVNELKKSLEIKLLKPSAALWNESSVGETCQEKKARLGLLRFANLRVLSRARLSLMLCYYPVVLS